MAKMSAEWEDCIVAVFDLIGIKDHAPGGHGSVIMRRLHQVVQDAIVDGGLRSIRRAYAWNDSVLLLAQVQNNQHGYELALQDFDMLRKRIDSVAKSYVVVVKGKLFPAPENGSTSEDERFVFIEASSYAMANCLEIIPRHFTDNQHTWYIDGRITNRISEKRLAPFAAHRCIKLLPSNDTRRVYAYDDIWRVMA